MYRKEIRKSNKHNTSDWLNYHIVKLVHHMPTKTNKQINHIDCDQLATKQFTGELHFTTWKKEYPVD